jgi:hypothetical protein
MRVAGWLREFRLMGFGFESQLLAEMVRDGRRGGGFCRDAG